ncbi:MAG: phytanoyl-CoA dioxygenase family protein [Saprospiraceae bacterium]
MNQNNKPSIAISTAENLAFFNKNGYLIVENFLSDEEIESIRKSARQIVDDFDMEALSVFTTEEQSQHTNRYFLESGSNVSCFFEPDALDEKGKLKRDKHLSVNKIGHAMHDLLPEWQRVSYNKSLCDFAKSIGHQKPAIVQSQYIYKQPQIGGRVHPHTDSTFIHTKPLSCLGAWMALEDADQSNGCLLAIPGSHKWPLQNQFVRMGDHSGTELILTDVERVEWKEEELIPLEVKKGALVLLHGSVVHASSLNSSDRSRHAFVLHLADLASEWSGENWLQRPADFPFRATEDGLGMES